METQIKKLSLLRQELVNNNRVGLKFSRQNPRSESDILNEMGNIIDEIENLLDYPTNNILHEFFNYKSDANKYLNAEQQEDLENDFYEWVKNNGSVLSFNEAVEPAIRYLFNNCDPHTKIYIDYSNAELLQGQKCHNLNNEIPD